MRKWKCVSSANLQLPFERQLYMHLYVLAGRWKTLCSIEYCTSQRNEVIITVVAMMV